MRKLAFAGLLGCCLLVAIALNQTRRFGSVELEGDKLDEIADRLAAVAAKAGNNHDALGDSIHNLAKSSAEPVEAHGRWIHRVPAYSAVKIGRARYPDGGYSGFSPKDHVISAGRVGPSFDTPTVLEREAKQVWGDYKSHYDATGRVQWNKMGHFSLEQPEISPLDRPSSQKIAEIRQQMAKVAEAAANSVEPQEVHRPYLRSAAKNSQLHWKNYVQQPWAGRAASQEPVNPVYVLGEDSAPYEYFADADRRVREAIQHHMEVNAEASARINELQKRFTDEPEEAAGSDAADVQSEADVQTDSNDANVHAGAESVQQPEEQVDEQQDLDSSKAARVEMVGDEAAQIANTVKQEVDKAAGGIENAVRSEIGEVQEAIGSQVHKQVDDEFARVIQPLIGKIESQGEQVNAQRKEMEEVRRTVDKLLKRTHHEDASSASSTSPTSFHVTIPGTIKVKDLELPGGSYEFGLGSSGQVAPSVVSVAPTVQPVQETGASKAISADKGVEGEQSSSVAEQADKAPAADDGILSSAVDMDNGIDMDAVQKAASDLQNKLIDELNTPVVTSTNGDKKEDAAASNHKTDDVLDSVNGMSAGVDLDAVKAAASALQKKLIDELLGGGDSGGKAASDDDAAADAGAATSDVLDSSTGMSTGIDKAAVQAAASALQKKVINEVNGGESDAADAKSSNDVLDSRVGMSSGVDEDAVRAAALKLQRNIISRLALAGSPTASVVDTAAS